MLRLLCFVGLMLVSNSIRLAEANKFNRFNPTFFLDLLNKYENLNDQSLNGFVLPDSEETFRPVSTPFRFASNRVAKDFDGYSRLDDDIPNNLFAEPVRTNNLELDFNGPSNNDNQMISHGIRDQEALEHSALWRHQMMQGGAGEGQQHLKPDGSVKNVQVVKSDAMLPAYCTPPNPCPPGYSEEDGCLSNFENSAAFSRQYQSVQDCMCDTEHMFNCDTRETRSNDQDTNQIRSEPVSSSSSSSSSSLNSYRNYLPEQERSETPEERDERQLDTIARSLANRPIDNEVAEHLLDTLVDHKVVAKKFVVSKQSSLHNLLLDGEKLPIVAKKSPSPSITE